MFYLHKRFFTGMYHFMEFQCICIGKRFAANITNIWPFIGVNAGKRKKEKHLQNHFLVKLKCFSCHLPMMFVPCRQISKGRRTITAFIGTITGMGIHVPRQLLCLGKGITTNSIHRSHIKIC